MAAGVMVVDHAHGLHEGIDRGRPHELPAQLLERLGKGLRLLGHRRAAIGRRLARRFVAPQECRQEPSRSIISSARPALLITASILPRWRTMPASASSTWISFHRSGPRAPDRNRKSRGERPRACSGWSASSGPTGNPPGSAVRTGRGRRPRDGPIPGRDRPCNRRSRRASRSGPAHREIGLEAHWWRSRRILRTRCYPGRRPSRAQRRICPMAARVRRRAFAGIAR